MKTEVGKKITIDEAIERRGDFGKDDEEFMKQIEEMQDERFTDLRILVFGWVDQPDGSKKLMTHLPNGKVCFPDRSVKLQEILPEVPYICLVHEREREAFAKIICEEYMPKIYVLPNKLVTMRWKEHNKIRWKMPHEKTYEHRILSAIKEFERMGVPYVFIVFRENEAKQKEKK